MTDTPACKGSQEISAHQLIELGDCPHEVGGATYVYRHSACTACGVTAGRVVVYACGTGKKAVRPTAENCIALRWKAERSAASSAS